MQYFYNSFYSFIYAESLETFLYSSPVLGVNPLVTLLDVLITLQ